MFIRCPGSIQMNARGGPERRTSQAAAEGTVAHEITEDCLAFGFEPEDYIGQTLSADGFDFVVDEEMAAFIREGVEWVRERPGRVVTEYRVDLSRWMPGQFGTLDVGIIADDLVTIWDLKYGAGVAVDAFEHEPTMAYALGFWDNVARHETGATNFLLHIYQPRNGQGGGEFRITLDDLLRWGETVLKPAYEKAILPDAPLVAGEKQCMFCGAKAICPAYARWSFEQFDLTLEDLDDMDDEAEITLRDVDELTPERRAHIAANYAALKAWLDAVHGRVLADAIAGLPTPGLKAVEGRGGHRFWQDREGAEAFLTKFIPADKVFVQPEPVMLSPAQAEKLLPKAERDGLKAFVDQPKGKPALVPQSHPKPALVPMSDKLDDLDD